MHLARNLQKQAPAGVTLLHSIVNEIQGRRKNIGGGNDDGAAVELPLLDSVRVDAAEPLSDALPEALQVGAKKPDSAGEPPPPTPSERDRPSNSRSKAR